MSHSCHATGCCVPVPPARLMCRRHWFSLPKTLRDSIWATYRPGQCDDKSPSVKYCRAAKAAVIYIARREGVKSDTQLYDWLGHLPEEPKEGERP